MVYGVRGAYQTEQIKLALKSADKELEQRAGPYNVL